VAVDGADKVRIGDAELQSHPDRVAVLRGATRALVSAAQDIAERLKVMLEQHGHFVTWRPTEDGHGLPSRRDFEEIARFLGQ
jgi:hypothetical protein